MKVLINSIDDNRFSDNPDNINVDDYELVNIISNDTDDFFVFQKLYSKNEGTSGLEYFRILNTPNDAQSVHDTPFIKVVDDLTNFLNIPKREIHERNEFIDNRNEDFLDFMSRVFMIKNPINIPDKYKKPVTVKREDVYGNLEKKLNSDIINPNFNYTIDNLNDEIFKDTKYVIEPAEVIFHGTNKILDINGLSSLKHNTQDYDGITHFNLTFHNFGINQLDRSSQYENMYYNIDDNTITYSGNYKIQMSDFKYFDKMIRRFPYVLNTGVEYINNPEQFNLRPNDRRDSYRNMYYYTKYFDFSKTNYKIKLDVNRFMDFPNNYDKIIKRNYDSSKLNILFTSNFYSSQFKPINVSGNILTFDLKDEDKYLQLFISNIFPRDMLSDTAMLHNVSTIYATRIIDTLYNKYITPYNLNMNVSTHLPYTDHHSRWHIQKVTSYNNNSIERFSLF